MENEKRLIDANNLTDALELLAKYEDDFKKTVILGVVRTVKNCPTVNAVEVVRCRECYFGKGELICTNPKCTKSFYGCPVPPEHFCSYGERKDHGSA